MTESVSRDAHAETNAHHASVCKACAMSCGADKPATCQGAERLGQLERTVKRLHVAVWIVLIAIIVLLAFWLGQRTQSRRDSMPPEPMGMRNPRGPNGMPNQMRGMNGMNGMNGNPNGKGNFEVRIERSENDKDGKRDDDKPKKRVKRDGDSAQNAGEQSQSPMPPSVK